MLLQPPAIVTTFTNVQFDLHISMFADAMWRDDGAAIIARGCHRNRACDRENMWSGYWRQFENLNGMQLSLEFCIFIGFRVNGVRQQIAIAANYT